MSAVTLEAAMAALTAQGDAERAGGSAAYHKAPRVYLGLSVPQIDRLTHDWRAACTLDERLDLASGLWNSNIHEARIAASRLLNQSRIRPSDEAAWQLIASWVPDFDGWAIADHACISGAKRLVADPGRIDQVETWTRAPDKWSRRAALVITLPWTKQNHPKPADLAIRERVLGWAASYAGDPDWFIQKAIGWWLRDLSKHSPERTMAFLAEHGPKMKPFAAREAARHLGTL